MSVLESFIHDPLVEWSRTGTFVVGRTCSVPIGSCCDWFDRGVCVTAAAAQQQQQQLQAASSSKKRGAVLAGKKPAPTPPPAGGETHNADGLKTIKRIDERLKVRFSRALLKLQCAAVGSRLVWCFWLVPSSGLLQREHQARWRRLGWPGHVCARPGPPPHQRGNVCGEPQLHVRGVDALLVT